MNCKTWLDQLLELLSGEPDKKRTLGCRTEAHRRQMQYLAFLEQNHGRQPEMETAYSGPH